MPKKTEEISLPGFTADQLLALSYASFLQAGWIPKFAGEDRLIAYTKISWGQPHETVIVDVRDAGLTVSSELPESASWDIMKKNKKNLAKFAAALDGLKQKASAENYSQWTTAIEALRNETVVTLEKEKLESEQVEKVMNLSAGSKTVTYALMFLNVAVFALMAINGVSLFEPTTGDLLSWGANYKPYTVDDGEWWRLLTSTFLHIGVIHLLFNMYALYMVGMYLEPMLGKPRYIVAYLCTGIFASLTSILWHGEEAVSAGASGAIFGLYGVFLALLTTNLIPKSVRQALLQSIGIFVVYNLVYGLKAGVDNAAHLGGVVSGFVMGYIYFPTLKNPSPAKSNTVAAIILLITLAVLGFIIFNS